MPDTRLNKRIDLNLNHFEKVLIDLLRQSRTSFRVLARKDLPNGPGVYVIWQRGWPIYVGESGNLGGRLYQHKQGQNSAFWGALEKASVPDTDLFVKGCSFSYLQLASSKRWTRSWRRQFEHFLLGALGPRFNFVEVEQGQARLAS